MRKLFLAICFSLLLTAPEAVFARAVELKDAAEFQAREQQALDAAPIIDERIPTGENREEMDNFIKERLKTVVISKLDENEDLESLKTIDVQHSAEYINTLKESKKSTFQKIYDSAMNRISGSGQNTREDLAPTYDDVYYYTNDTPADNVAQQQQEWQKPDFAVVDVELPNGEKVLAPAKEHIPYLFSQIEILPTGLIKVNETVVVVANGEKLKNGLSRSIPKYSTSRINVRHKVDVDLLSVTINGQDVPHKLEEVGNNIVITPQQTYQMQPGVYTYQFDYILDRQLWYYDEFNEFYWDVTGSTWNLVIARAGASVSVPGELKALSQNVLLGYPPELTQDGAFVTEGRNNTLGFAAQVPLFIGEGMHIIISIPKSDFVTPDFNKLFSWFVADYGDILFSGLALAAILISYILSWKYISLGHSKQKSGLKKTAPILRYLIKSVFDKTSFAAWLLELFRKNIIDIQESGGSILLIKKTDSLNSLNRKERKALANLFPNKESVIAVNAQNMLKIRRAFKLVEKDTQNTIKHLALKLNFGYLCFSIGMLILAEIAISLLSVNFAQSLAILLSCTITIAFYVWILKLKFKSKLLGYFSKGMGMLIIFFSLLIMSVYIHPISSLLILIIIYAIFAYTSIFAKRSGLIRNNIKEAAAYKDYLLNSAESIAMGRDFLTQQANILALDLADKFKNAPAIKDYYRLDIVSELIKKL